MKRINLTRLRSSKGSSILIPALVALALICSILVMLSMQIQIALLRHNRAQAATEAAALALAGDLSRIVIKDPQWGFVSLSDHAAAGKKTIAADGEALPVTGLNTMLATVRQEKLIAAALASDELDALAEEDLHETRQSCNRLQELLDKAVTPQCTAVLEDMNGETIQPYKHACKQISANIPELAEGTARLLSVDARLGWLEEGSSTVTPDPSRDSQQSELKYKAFVNLPVKKTDFFFAGLSDQPRLVSTSRFQKADGKRFRSAILVTTKIAFYTPDKKLLYELCSTAAALPNADVDRAAKGSLVMHLPQGKLTGAESLRDLLCSQPVRNSQASLSRAANGDYPAEPGSQLLPSHLKETLSARVGRAMFDWMRSTRAQARTDALLEAINTPFICGADQMDAMIVLGLDKKGNLKKRQYNGSRLQHTVAEAQDFIMATQVARTNKGLLGISIRDQVAHIGDSSGQHGGQPLPNELPYEPGEKAPDSKLRLSSVRGGLAVCIQLFATPG